MTRPDPAAVAFAAFATLDGGICAIAREPIAALVFAALAAAALILFWHIPTQTQNGDLEALAAAVTCRACHPQPDGPCTCGRDCGHLRCTRAPKDEPRPPARRRTRP